MKIYFSLKVHINRNGKVAGNKESSD